MKKSLMVIALALFSVSLISCANQKKTPTKLRRGDADGRGNAVQVTGPGSTPVGQTQGTGWDILSALPKSDITDPNFTMNATQYINSFWDEQPGPIQGGTVSMRLQFANGQIDPRNSRLGFTIWDTIAMSNYIPFSTYFGPEISSRIWVQTNQNGSITILFSDDYGSVAIVGSFTQNTFSGNIQYSVGEGGDFRLLGSFTLPIQGVIISN